MRKADYVILAHAIRTAIAQHAANAALRGMAGAIHQSKANALDALARELADRLSVDRAAFLRECGIG